MNSTESSTLSVVKTRQPQFDPETQKRPGNYPRPYRFARQPQNGGLSSIVMTPLTAASFHAANTSSSGTHTGLQSRSLTGHIQAAQKPGPFLDRPVTGTR